MDTKKVATGIKIFGVVMAILVAICIVYSLTHTPVTDGPEPPMPTDPSFGKHK